MMEHMSEGMKMWDEKSAEEVKGDWSLGWQREKLISLWWMKDDRVGVGYETENR